MYNLSLDPVLRVIYGMAKKKIKIVIYSYLTLGVNLRKKSITCLVSVFKVS